MTALSAAMHLPLSCLLLYSLLSRREAAPGATPFSREKEPAIAITLPREMGVLRCLQPCISPSPVYCSTLSFLAAKRRRVPMAASFAAMLPSSGSAPASIASRSPARQGVLDSSGGRFRTGWHVALPCILSVLCVSAVNLPFALPPNAGWALRCHTEFSPVLGAMGMTNAFVYELADFSGITRQPHRGRFCSWDGWSTRRQAIEIGH